MYCYSRILVWIYPPPSSSTTRANFSPPHRFPHICSVLKSEEPQISKDRQVATGDDVCTVVMCYLILFFLKSIFFALPYSLYSTLRIAQRAPTYLLCITNHASRYIVHTVPAFASMRLTCVVLPYCTAYSFNSSFPLFLRSPPPSPLPLLSLSPSLPLSLSPSPVSRWHSYRTLQRMSRAR